MKKYWIVLTLLMPMTSNAFDSIAHEAITYSAFSHLKSHVHLSRATDRWTTLLGKDQRFAEDLLARAAVDADYHLDVWVDAAFHKPFTGASDGRSVSQFTSILHFVNVTRRGAFWDYDGYSYEQSTRKGVDGYMNFPSLAPRGDLSPALGGIAPGRSAHGVVPGAMRSGFSGTEEQWNRLYDRSTSMGRVAFPPSDVVAQVNFDAMLKSKRSASTFTESWEEISPLATGAFSSGYRKRRYWRGEIRGMPEGLDLLGTTLHMAHDAAIPQHAQGTGENCHQDLESLADRLACGTPRDPDMSAYYDGSFGSEPPDCQHLYDPELVERIRAQVPELDSATPLSVRARIQGVARRAAAWTWTRAEDSVEVTSTRLPDGTQISGNGCGELIQDERVQHQLKYQYNLAVAVSIALFEDAALGYEDR